MNYAELEAFWAVEKYGNMTKAAESLFITQPALTKRICELEKELGCSLFERRKGKRRVYLTDQGKLFSPMAARYAELDNKIHALKNIHRRRTFTIYSSDGPHLYALAGAYKEYVKLHPELSLQLVTANYPQCFDAVRHQRADLAFTGADFYYDNLTVKPAYSEPMCFVCRSDSDYPDVIAPSSLNVENAIYSPYSTDFEKWWNYWFHHNPPYIEVHLIAQVKDFLLSSGKYAWSIVPSSVRDDFVKNPALSTRNLSAEPPERMIYCVASDLNHVFFIEEFLRMLKDNLNQIQGVHCFL